MSILWDAPLTASLARELHDRLAGARLRAVRMDRESRDLVLHFRDGTLVFRLHPMHGDLALLDAREPGPGSETLKGTCRHVIAPPDERILMLQIQPTRGGSSPEGIVVELMTNQWNAIWLDVATDRIRRVLWSRTLQERVLARGEDYRSPASSERRGIHEPFESATWLQLVEGSDRNDARAEILRSVAFTSSLNVGALLDAEPDDGYRLWRRIRDVALGESEPEPCVLDTEKRRVPYPLPLPGTPSTPADSLLAAFEVVARTSDDEAPPAAAVVPSELLDRLERAAMEAERKADRLREELAQAPDPESIRRVGDLILARLHEISKGEERATIEGFDGMPVEIELDPALSPHENADRYYREAAKAERAADRLPSLVRKALDEAAGLRAAAARAKRGVASPDEIAALLPERGAPGGGGGRREGPKLPYRKYRSSGGLEIRVGRGARANDELTFHHSSPDDVWLHARQAPGAHVILRWQREGSPPKRDLAQAASLAAFHSDARHASGVPVDWTRRKYVRSPRKSPPGAVIPDRVSTVFVDPDPDLEKRLRVD